MKYFKGGGGGTFYVTVPWKEVRLGIAEADTTETTFP